MSEISQLTKIKPHGLKRKKPPSSIASSKRKKRRMDDSSSTFSLTPSLAYGACDMSDPDDPDDDENDYMVEKQLNFINFDTANLNRENGILFSEDLTDNYEIWTLQCSDVNINEFQGKNINFDEVSSLKIQNSMSDKVDLIPYKSQKQTTVTIVTPSEKTKQLSLNVVPLAGTIIMSNRVKKVKLENQKSLSADTIENATRQRSELMTKITQRLSQKFDKKSPQKIKKKTGTLNMSNQVKPKLEYQTTLPDDTAKDEARQHSELSLKITQNDNMGIQNINELESPRRKKKKTGMLNMSNLVKPKLEYQTTLLDDTAKDGARQYSELSLKITQNDNMGIQIKNEIESPRKKKKKSKGIATS